MIKSNQVEERFRLQVSVLHADGFNGVHLVEFRPLYDHPSESIARAIVSTTNGHSRIARWALLMSSVAGDADILAQAAIEHVQEFLHGKPSYKLIYAEDNSHKFVHQYIQ